MNITNQKNTEARERGTKEPACLDYRNKTTHPQKKDTLMPFPCKKWPCKRLGSDYQSSSYELPMKWTCLGV